MEIAVMRPIGAHDETNRGPGLGPIRAMFLGLGRQQQSFRSARRMIDTVAVTRGRVSLSPCTAQWSMKIKNNIFGTQ
jgi:hypothetical protein